MMPGVVQHSLEDLAQRIQETGGKIEVADLQVVMGDELQMYQLFQNLIGNALKFVPPGRAPHVIVSSRRIEKEMAEITVADNGIGFDERFLEKIFQPFQRLHNEQEYPGSGIGLAVCQKIVQRHGGTITAHSRPGEGSTFVITLPEHA
jgi:signal transduction histidine kinase